MADQWEVAGSTPASEWEVDKTTPDVPPAAGPHVDMKTSLIPSIARGVIRDVPPAVGTAAGVIGGGAATASPFGAIAGAGLGAAAGETASQAISRAVFGEGPTPTSKQGLIRTGVAGVGGAAAEGTAQGLIHPLEGLSSMLSDLPVVRQLGKFFRMPEEPIVGATKTAIQEGRAAKVPVRIPKYAQEVAEVPGIPRAPGEFAPSSTGVKLIPEPTRELPGGKGSAFSATRGEGGQLESLEQRGFETGNVGQIQGPRLIVPKESGYEGSVRSRETIDEGPVHPADMSGEDVVRPGAASASNVSEGPIKTSTILKPAPKGFINPETSDNPYASKDPADIEREQRNLETRQSADEWKKLTDEQKEALRNAKGRRK